ncbi:uncharacterized protein PG998_013530 [Apiospora kogelbergensis]|uniref:uncharacterized protein n=1 Tax=Apiospora kogelbergensis TaxID=1337665 RepID=UPI00313078F6
MSSEPESDLESHAHDETGHDVDESSSDESDESGESDEGESYGFLDVEAEESGDESDEDGMNDGSEDGFEFESFPQFTHLPPELRQRIWEFFDPDMRAPARIFGFRMPFNGANELHEGPLLERQTAPARAMLATHQESRAYALRYYPDAIEKAGEPDIIRYRKETDIIMVSGYFRDFATISSWQDSYVFTGIHNIAFHLEGAAENQYENLLSIECPNWPNLQSTYFVTRAIEHHMRKLRWCGSDAVQTYHLQVEELETGLGEDYEAIYCWPQGKEREHTNYAIFGREEETEETEEMEEMETEEAGNSSLGQTCSVIKTGERTIWPIVVFDFEGSGVRRYDKLREIYPADGDWEKAGDWQSDEFSGDEDELSPDEYESEGIDDGTIDEDEGSGDEDDLHVLDDESEQEDDASAFNGFSPLPEDFAAVVEPTNFSSVEPESARFSSVEPESPGHSDAEEKCTSDESSRNAQRPRRRVIADSEDESGDEGGDGEKMAAQLPSRRKRVVVSDSEEDEEMDDEEEDVKPNRRRKRAVSDSEAEEDVADEEGQTRSNKRRKRVVESDSEDEGEASRSNKRRRRAVMPESDDNDSATEQGEDESDGEDEDESDEEDEDSEEDEKPQKKPSLAERLQLFRSEVPVAPSPEPGSEPDSDMEQLRNGDYDDPYADTYDRDDEGEGDALSENDQLLDMDGDEGDTYGDDGDY